MMGVRNNFKKVEGEMSEGKAGVLVILLLIIVGLDPIFCEAFNTALHLEISNIEHAAAPRVMGGSILLSYSPLSISKSVALAMEYEDYRILHRYQKNKHGVFVLSLPLPEEKQKIRYRLIVDGLWTTDPNAGIERDSRRFLVSYFILPDTSGAPAPGVKVLPDGRIRFTHRSAPGNSVSLVGDFNRWDPFLTPVPESPVYPGVYSVTLTLPDEAKYYRYVLNGKEITDPENPRIARNGLGESVSVIE